jgi:hypothetical protein
MSAACTMTLSDERGEPRWRYVDGARVALAARALLARDGWWTEGSTMTLSDEWGRRLWAPAGSSRMCLGTD